MSLRDVARGIAESVLLRLPSATKPGDRLILAYHNVVPSDCSARGDRSLHLRVDAFERQLRAIRDEAEIVSLMELLTEDAPHSRRVAITFDDAYASALRLGVGACVSSAVPCTVFVAPGLLNTIPPWDRLAELNAWSEADRHAFLWQHKGRDSAASGGASEAEGGALPAVDDSLRIASLNELQSLIASTGTDVTLGNHTMTHANLGALTVQEARGEIDEAAAWLREQLPTALVPVIAYPYGHSPVHPEQSVSSDAARFGLLVSGGWFAAAPHHEALAIPRWNVPAGVSLDGFVVRLRGRLRGR